MLVGDGLEINLGLDDVQQRTLRRLAFRLGGIQHVVGTRRHLGGMFFRRTDRTERFYSYHKVIVLGEKGGRFRTRLFPIIHIDYLLTWKRVLPFFRKSTIWLAAARPALMLASAVSAPIFFAVAKTRLPNFSSSSA